MAVPTSKIVDLRESKAMCTRDISELHEEMLRTEAALALGNFTVGSEVHTKLHREFRLMKLQMDFLVKLQKKIQEDLDKLV